MKRFLFFLYIVIFSFSFYIYIDLISSKQEDSMKKAGKEDSFVVTINENALKIDSEKFLSLLFRISDDYNANVFKSIYSGKKSVEYVYFTHDIDSYFTNFLLLDGVFPDNKSDEFNISTLKDKSVTGEIFSYKEESDFSIKPLKSFPKDKSVAGDYIVSLKDKNKIDLFIDRLQRDLGMKINYFSYEYNPVIDS
ncbi:bacteriocin-associated protein, partial [Bacillus cereus]|nr:bacteriocin-associated protein [Bacillus cereus]